MNESPEISMLAAELLGELRAHANAENLEGMSRYGISPVGTLGVTMPVVRTLASSARKALRRQPAARHELAALLWSSGVHEARILAALVDLPALVDEPQMEAWAADLDSWDVCDQLCLNLFRLAPLAWQKAAEWPLRAEEFVKRAGFVLGATLAVHDKAADDSRFLPLLALAEEGTCDERNMVKKAVNWQVRQIGKRSATLNTAAIATCERILARHPTSKSARWIARDALRELRSDAVRSRLHL
ncbi:MAG: DNA alkylation repair protein [Coriobacteriia bacterium]